MKRNKSTKKLRYSQSIKRYRALPLQWRQISELSKVVWIHTV